MKIQTSGWLRELGAGDPDGDGQRVRVREQQDRQSNRLAPVCGCCSPAALRLYLPSHGKRGTETSAKCVFPDLYRPLLVHPHGRLLCCCISAFIYIYIKASLQLHVFIFFQVSSPH